jgi:hypothetical protein
VLQATGAKAYPRRGTGAGAPRPAAMRAVRACA